MVDELRTGTWITFTGDRATARRIRKCRLVVTHGPDAGQTGEFGVAQIRIGARRGADLQLTDPKVSGLHAEICLLDSGYRVRDLGSRNGTFVGSVRVFDAELSAGATIALGQSRLRFEPLDDSIEQPLANDDRFGPLVGASPIMRSLFAQLSAAANSESNLVLFGESGTGKELAALAIHEASRRSGGPFFVVDCRTLSFEHADRELFGAAATAWTPSVRGAIARAEQGTLLLDEVAEIPFALQSRLVGLLDRREYHLAGSSTPVAADVRVIATTHRDLRLEVNRGRFREDLFYRLSEVSILTPPLRDHKEDIPELVSTILQQLPPPRPDSLSQAAMQRLYEHEWPGNVRELRNVIERAVLSIDHAPMPPSPALTSTTAPTLDVDINVPFKIAKQHVVEEFERRYIQALLEQHHGNVSAAARAAGLDRMSVHKILQRVTKS